MCFVFIPEKSSDLRHLRHKLISFYNRDEKCLQRGTDWVFKYSGLRFVFKRLVGTLFEIVLFILCLSLLLPLFNTKNTATKSFAVCDPLWAVTNFRQPSKKKSPVCTYWGALKSLARPGRKQATATKL